ncbi:MAG: zinc-binding dehydrogenase [Elusimicrobia bacterium]|nr:zinc-binding dehydrogenase [Elusimicrobiota bacterium]
MEKIVIHRPGGFGELRLETHPDPAPGPGEVLVRTKAVGVNFADCVVRRGLYASAKKYVGWPITPGFDIAGHVAAAGPDVDHFNKGDAVFGITRFGGYATHVAVPARQLRPLPKALSMEEAAAFPAVFLTAYHALHQNIRLRPGMTALVHSAAGGVGGALCQILKIAKCEVVGVVGSAAKTGFALAGGAHAVIDKSAGNFWAKARQLAPQGYDLILDANGADTLKESYRHLGPSGKLIVYGFHSMFPKAGGGTNWLHIIRDVIRMPRFNPLRMTQENKSVIAFNLSFLFSRTDLYDEAMDELIRWLGEGRLKPPQVTVYPLSEAARAQEVLESGRTTGKLVLSTSGGSLN